MKYRHIVKIMKNPLLLILTIFTIICEIIAYPFFYLKSKLFRLNSIKTDIFNTLNQLYGVQINQDDYKFEKNILPGLKLVKPETFFKTFARSVKVDKGTCFEVVIDNHKNDFDFPVLHEMQSSLNRISKLFRIKQMVYIHFEKFKITRVQLKIQLITDTFQNSTPLWGGAGVRPSKTLLYVELTQNLDIINIQKIIPNDDIRAMLRYVKTYKHMTFDEVSLLLYLELLTDREDIHALIPEIKTPSAYDFNSDEFKQRLLLVEMMEY